MAVLLLSSSRHLDRNMLRWSCWFETQACFFRTLILILNHPLVAFFPVLTSSRPLHATFRTTSSSLSACIRWQWEAHRRKKSTLVLHITTIHWHRNCPSNEARNCLQHLIACSQKLHLAIETRTTEYETGWQVLTPVQERLQVKHQVSHHMISSLSSGLGSVILRTNDVFG